MRIGIDADSIGADKQKSGLYYHTLGLLRGLAALRPRPRVTLLLGGEDPSRVQGAAEFQREHGLAMPVGVYHQPRGRPYNLKAWVADTRAGLTGLDVILNLSYPHFPASPRRVNAYLIPDLTFRRSAAHHTDGSRGHWEGVLANAHDNADLFITFSEHTRRELIDALQVPPDTVAAVPLAAGDEFRPRSADDLRGPLAELGLTHHGYVLTVGTLQPRKNHIGLFRAYADYLRRPGAPQLPLVVVGPRGWLDEPILAEPEKLGIADKVRFLGRVPDLAGLYAGAAVAVYLSLDEGFGLPPLEAMACGAATVTSNATSLPEVVGDGGLLVRPDDPAGAADALYKVLTDDRLRADLAARGLQRAAKFSWRATAEGYVAAFRAAADRKRTGRPARRNLLGG